jgi:hypothetical protein
MLPFILGVAFLDQIWIGEFGAGHTHPALTFLGFLVAVYGFAGGFRALSAAIGARGACAPRTLLEAGLFLAMQIGPFLIWAMRILPPDHASLIAAALLTAVVAFANNKAGRASQGGRRGVREI